MYTPIRKTLAELGDASVDIHTLELTVGNVRVRYAKAPFDPEVPCAVFP